MKELTLVLVEDSEDDAYLMQRAFKAADANCPIELLPDGEAALNYLAGKIPYTDRRRYPVPSLLILDLKLPRKNGFEVLDWIRHQPAMHLLPVLVLTSSKETTDIEKAYRLGANAYLVKPSSLRELTDLARAICQFWIRFNECPL